MKLSEFFAALGVDLDQPPERFSEFNEPPFGHWYRIGPITLSGLRDKVGQETGMLLKQSVIVTYTLDDAAAFVTGVGEDNYIRDVRVGGMPRPNVKPPSQPNS